MLGNPGIKFRISFRMVSRLVSRPAWFVTFFLLVVCLLPFAGPTTSFRGEAIHILDTFGFSLLVPRVGAFGPMEFLSLSALFIITTSLIDFDRSEISINSTACRGVINPGTLALSSVLLYGLFLILCLPLLARSHAFPGVVALVMAIGDLIIRAIALAWVVSFAMELTGDTRLRSLVCWIAAGVFYLALAVSDAWLIPPQARELVEVDFTVLLWHAIIALAAMTLHALPVPLTKPRTG